MGAPDFQSVSSTIGVVTALIAPALLISASGTFILSTSNRLTRVVDRVRQISDRIDLLASGKLELPLLAQRRQTFEAQLLLMSERARLLQRALQALYTAAGIFVGSSLALGVEAFIGMLPRWLPVVIALVGAFVLLVACVLLMLEARRQAASMRHEMSFLQSLVEHTRQLGRG